MTEAFNDAIRRTLASRKMTIGAKKKEKPADPGELLARAQAALEELQTVLAELAAAEPAQEDETAEEGA